MIWETVELLCVSRREGGREGGGRGGRKESKKGRRRWKIKDEKRGIKNRTGRKGEGE